MQHAFSFLDSGSSPQQLGHMILWHVDPTQQSKASPLLSAPHSEHFILAARARGGETKTAGPPTREASLESSIAASTTGVAHMKVGTGDGVGSGKYKWPCSMAAAISSIPSSRTLCSTAFLCPRQGRHRST